MTEKAEGGLSSYRPSHPWRWLPEFLQLGRARMRTQGRVLGAAILVGVVAGLGAILFSAACNLVVWFALEQVAGYQEDTPPKHEASLRRFFPQLPEVTDASSPNPWLLLLVAATGGLISGFVVFKFAPEAEGHGTDAAIDAYHNKQGYIRPRVPLIKLIASAVTIGTGGSGGREGPIAQIGAGFGSILGRVLKLRPAERRILLAAGVGAGIAAIFRAPLAGALFAAEVLYSSPEFEADVIIPAGIASVVSYSTFGLVFGWAPLFEVPLLHFDNALRLLPYLVLGVFMALLAMIYTRTFYFVTYLFHKLPISVFLKPALGAVLSVLVGLALYFAWPLVSHSGQKFTLAVLSFGYGILQQGFLDSPTNPLLPAAVLLAVAFGKILTTSLTIGSGGSGGVFGPSMVIGGCAGGAFGLLVRSLFPELVPNPASFMIVGMAGFFAAAGKVPFSTMVIVSEMTGNYGLFVPALLVCSLSYLLSDEQSLYRSQVESRSRSPAHTGEYVKEVLKGVLLSQFLKSESLQFFVRPQDPLTTVVERLSSSPYTVLPVVDGDHKLLGVVVLNEIYQASQSPHASPWILAADLMRSPIQPLQLTDSVDRAQELFVLNDLYALPVVDGAGTVLGTVKRSDVARMYLKHVHGPATESPTPQTGKQ